MLATGEDYRFDGVEGGSRTIGTRMMHRYPDRVVHLTTERADVRQVMLDVFHMMRRPSALSPQVTDSGTAGERAPEGHLDHDD
jgi:hypothetical protein